MVKKQAIASASVVVMLALASSAGAEPRPAEPRPAEAADRQTGRFELGVGFMPDDGFVATTEIAQDDLLGTGRGVSLAAELSERRQRFGARLVDPDLLGSRWRLDVTMGVDDRRYPGFWRRAVGAQATVSRTLAPNLTGFLGYRLEQVSVSLETLAADPARGTAAPQPLTYRLGTLRAGFDYTTLNHAMPTRGSRAGVAIETADRQLGSEVDFTRVEVWAEHHRALGPLVLHASGRAAMVSGTTPFAERLHFDGSRDIRGYQPGALGPMDPRTGSSRGGTAMATGRLELELPLVKRWNLALVGFLDVGTVAGDGDHTSGASVGIGLLWRSPIGPIRIDLARPLDGGRGLVPLFSLGGAF